MRIFVLTPRKTEVRRIYETDTRTMDTKFIITIKCGPDSAAVDGANRLFTAKGYFQGVICEQQ